jgi:hypothetical protein
MARLESLAHRALEIVTVEPSTAQVQSAIEQKMKGGRVVPGTFHLHAVEDLEPVSLHGEARLQIVVVDQKIAGSRQGRGRQREPAEKHRRKPK